MTMSSRWRARRAAPRPLGVLVDNAGVATATPLDDVGVDDWETMIDVNVKGVPPGTAAKIVIPPDAIARAAAFAIERPAAGRTATRSSSGRRPRTERAL